MGLDFVEIIMTVEHEFCVEIPDETLHKLMLAHSPPDLTVAELASFVCATAPAFCFECKYDLQGQPRAGTCPQCGLRYKSFDYQPVRDELRRIVANGAGIAMKKIGDDSLFFKDLRIE